VTPLLDLIDAILGAILHAILLVWDTAHLSTLMSKLASTKALMVLGLNFFGSFAFQQCINN